MKKKLRKISALLVFSFLFGAMTMGLSAEDFSISENYTSYYTKEHEEILEKIELLGQLKAKAVSTSEFFKLDKHPDVKLDMYENLLDEIEIIRNDYAKRLIRI